VQPPALNPEQQAQLAVTTRLIAEAIGQAGGRVPFDRFMELALYAPGAGYYVNGSHKFGAGGDFVTAPEISPLFSRCLAQQCAQVLRALGGGDILEFGAGSGVMAADVLLHLQDTGNLPQRYLILELSPDLQARQRETLQRKAPDLLSRVHWLQQLPVPGWRGVVLGNEVLDAMPVHRFRRTADGWQELYVACDGPRFREAWDDVPSPGLQSALHTLVARVGDFAPGYCSEINLRLPGWLQALAGFLDQGAVLLVDYGYSGAEYYHPERSQGTLICHFQHRAHADPLVLPGLQDITANVDFSAVAHAALDAGLELAGYTTQVHFLIGNGIEHLLAASDAADAGAYMDLVQGLKQLTLPGAMGERFKVIGLQRGLEQPLQGFAQRDMRACL
jgi:SAM-dependent MidA family methyltransferase